MLLGKKKSDMFLVSWSTENGDFQRAKKTEVKHHRLPLNFSLGNHFD
jgi:hypothetical protein